MAGQEKMHNFKLFAVVQFDLLSKSSNFNSNATTLKSFVLMVDGKEWKIQREE